MKICLSILEDKLKLPVLYRDAKRNCQELGLEKFAHYRGELHLLEGILYIASSIDLPETMEYEQNAALICIGNPPPFYQKSDLPLLIYDGTTDLFQLANAVFRVFDQFRQLEKKLNEGLYNGYDYQYLAETFAPYLQNELIIIDSNFLVLAQSSKESLLLKHSGLPQPESNGMLPLELVNYFKGNGTFGRMKSMREPFFYEESIFRYRNLCANIIFEHDFACRIVVAETERPFHDYDPLLLNYFADFVQRTYESTVIGKPDFSHYSLAEVLHEMLSGNHVDIWQIQRALRARDWGESGDFLCMCIKPSRGDYLNRTLYYYCGMINNHFPGIVAFEYGQEIVCLINLHFYENSESIFRVRFAPILRDNDFRAGFSDIFEKIDHFSYSFRQASIALTMGGPVEPTKWFYHFSEQVLDYFIQPFCDFENVMVLCAKEILLLQDHDAKNGTAFVQTAVAYYDHRLNTVKTAAALFIHRATMIHRLERIKEISGLDFTDAQKNLYCQLSLRLLNRYHRFTSVDTQRPSVSARKG